MNLIGSIAATVSGLSQSGVLLTRVDGGVDVWSDGSFTVFSRHDDVAEVYATGAVIRGQRSPAATVRAVARMVLDDHGRDVTLDPQSIEIYP